MKRLTVFSILIAFCLTLVVSARIFSQEKEAPAKPEDKALSLEMVGAWMPKSVTVNRNTSGPAEGHFFVALLARLKGVKSIAGFHRAIFGENGIVGNSTYPDEGGHFYSTDAVLVDSAGGRYLPVGGMSSGMAFYRKSTMMSDELKIDGAADRSVSSALLYLYEIPNGRSGFKLSVGAAPPVPVEIASK